MKLSPPTLLLVGLIATAAGTALFSADGPAAAAAKPAEVHAFIDDTQPGFRSLGAADFTKVNSADDTWSWKDGVLH